MTICVRCVQDPDDESTQWDVVENDELTPGKGGRWYSTRAAAEAAAKEVQG